MCENVDRICTKDEDELQFITEVALFSNKHALVDDASEQIYKYVVCKLGSHIFTYGTILKTTEDCIYYNKSGAACGGIGDCDGVEWDETWSITYMETDCQYEIDNNRLNNKKKYYDFGRNIHDEFFCKDPFGLEGIYKIQYDFRENDA